jgi:hypothetical protein
MVQEGLICGHVVGMIARDRLPGGSLGPCPCPKFYRVTRVDRVDDYLNLEENRLSKFYFASILVSAPSYRFAGRRASEPFQPHVLLSKVCSVAAVRGNTKV